eukprot:GHVP01000670.1.p5 GENE.GHVP01000670.1~~GHVP01000670.1.p5  ORF type:complete len:101 (-),score=3.65 GHVP01000670.1:246-548(-)
MWMGGVPAPLLVRTPLFREGRRAAGIMGVEGEEDGEMGSGCLGLGGTVKETGSGRSGRWVVGAKSDITCVGGVLLRLNMVGESSGGYWNELDGDWEAERT